MGTLAIEGMEFFAHIGYYQEEKTKGNSFTVDLYVQADIEEGAVSDELEETLDYEEVYHLVEKVMGQRANLIEHVGNNILAELGARFSRLKHAKVRVHKHHPPINGKVGRVFVEMTRDYTS